MGKLVVSTKDLFSCDDLSNLKVRHIVQDLVCALDNNSVEQIRELKAVYGKTKEFSLAKKFLNRKCKEIWNPLDGKKLSLPKESMKCLGITNEPELRLLLEDSLKYFEKKDSIVTVKVIKSILSNENLSYTIQDIYNCLIILCKELNITLNSQTLKYLIFEQNYNIKELCEKNLANTNALQAISISDKIKLACKEMRCLLKPFATGI